MNALILSQTVFYFSFSFLILVFITSAILISYYLIRIAKNLNKLSEDLHTASEEVRENIKDIMGQLSKLPFLSFLLDKSLEKKSKKGRSK